MRGRAWRGGGAAAEAVRSDARSPTRSRRGSPRTATATRRSSPGASSSALHASGVIDVQSHTDSHSRIFASPTVEDFVQPGYEATPLLNRPQLSAPPCARLRDAGRSRRAALRHALADVRRPPRARVARGPREVRELWSRAKAARRSSRAPTGAPGSHAIVAAAPTPPFESADDQARAIEDELARSRSILNDRLKTQSVAHICLPWGISGAQHRDAARSAPAIDRRSPTGCAGSTPSTPATIRTG